MSLRNDIGIKQLTRLLPEGVAAPAAWLAAKGYPPPIGAQIRAQRLVDPLGSWGICPCRSACGMGGGVVGFVAARQHALPCGRFVGPEPAGIGPFPSIGRRTAHSSNERSQTALVGPGRRPGPCPDL